MRSIITRLFILILVMSSTLLGADRWIGTWKYNLPKSSSTAKNPIRNRTEAIEATPDGGVKVTRTEQLADGTLYKYTYLLKYDGKDYPVKGAPFDSIRATRVDENTHTFEIKNSKNKYHLTGKATVSPDGKTRTQTSTGTDMNGAPLAATSVYDRQ